MKTRPGKFEGCGDSRLAEVLFSTDTDMDIGSVSELGWYGLIVHRDHAYIVNEDHYGFFSYSRHTIPEAETIFNDIELEYDTYYEEDEE